MSKSSPNKPAKAAPATPPAAQPPGGDSSLTDGVNLLTGGKDAPAAGETAVQRHESSREPTAQEMAEEIRPEDLSKLREVLAIAEANAASGAAAGDPDEEMVRVYHLRNSGGSFIHGAYRLEPGGNTLVPRSVADIWIGHRGFNGAELVSVNPAGGDEAPENPLAAEVAKLREANTSKDDKLAEAEARLRNLEKALADMQSAAGQPRTLPGTPPDPAQT